jgi:hypothetical protein
MLTAITVSDGGDGKRVVRSSPIVMDDKQQLEVFDGIHGRTGFLVSRAQIVVASFV